MGLDHVGIVTADIDKTLDFYLAALKPLGFVFSPAPSSLLILHPPSNLPSYRRIVTLGSGTVNGLGSTFPDFWVSSLAPLTTSDPSNPPPPHPHATAPLHLCFSASSRKQVREFHKAALAAGAKCNGPPGIRDMYHRWYYGAFVWDSEGRNIENPLNVTNTLAIPSPLSATMSTPSETPQERIEISTQPSTTLSPQTHQPITLSIHAADHLNPVPDIAPPLHVSTTYRYSPPFTPASSGNSTYFSDPVPPNYIYSRLTSPSTVSLETTLTHLLHGHATVFSSGLSAFTALLLRTNPKRLLISGGYHGCHGAAHVLQRVSGMEIRDLHTTAPQAGDLLHLETPENPTGIAHPIRVYAEKAHAVGALLSVDATFAPPPLQDPFAEGADWVMHSGTKYFGGHSDMLCGVLVSKDLEQVKLLKEERMYIGGVMGSLESWLGVRSLKTLHLRLERQSRNATELVRWLKDEVEGKGVVEKVMEHCALQARKEGEEGEWVRKQMPGGYAPVFSALLKTREMAQKLPGELDLWLHATSLGGVESLIEWRALSDPSCDQRLLRFSVGVEDVNDLRRDLENGFKKIAEA
ncbi:PLP-dependent transferase [Ascodesmis nigricans]|uniref:PLP-dependent transferase n=1 Tax=Ascodesmis nigricans TaxID=341454 RepID=A0A4S2MVQ3_9PEZI|nr:PLP-dependent transferase [Ascodesmis nigricans]